MQVLTRLNARCSFAVNGLAAAAPSVRVKAQHCRRRRDEVQALYAHYLHRQGDAAAPRLRRVRNAA
jgi:hypothetical protein